MKTLSNYTLLRWKAFESVGRDKQMRVFVAGVPSSLSPRPPFFPAFSLPFPFPVYAGYAGYVFCPLAIVNKEIHRNDCFNEKGHFVILFWCIRNVIRRHLYSLNAGIVNSTSPASFKTALRHVFVTTTSNLRYVFTFASNCSCIVYCNFPSP